MTVPVGGRVGVTGPPPSLGIKAFARELKVIRIEMRRLRAWLWEPRVLTPDTMFFGEELFNQIRRAKRDGVRKRT
jgi:hypothetical protein